MNTDELNVSHWTYRGEGNANVVLKYTGQAPSFHNTVLRLRKTDKTRQLTTSNISNEVEYASEVMGLLLGKEYVGQLVPVKLTQTFLKDLTAVIEPLRPKDRRHRVIDLTQQCGFLALDHSMFMFHSRKYSTACVEIKPKWCFLPRPDSPFIDDSESVKKRVCRFCMYQHSKVWEKKVDSVSEYCPLQLCTREPHWVRNALLGLSRSPQNNMRLFVNGVEENVARVTVSEGPGNPLVCNQDVIGQSGQAGDCQPKEGEFVGEPTLVDVLTAIFTRSPILERLARLQLGLDWFDVSTIERWYRQYVARHPGTVIPEPTPKEYLAAAEAFLRRSNLNVMVGKTREEFVNHLASNTELDPLEINIPDSLMKQFFCEFLLSTTLKDCSILIAVRKVDEPLDQVESTYHSKRNDVSQVFTENIQWIEVNGRVYEYKLTFVDLDPRKLNNVPKYREKDKTIVEHYKEHVASSDIKSCNLVGMILLFIGTFVYFAPAAVFVTSTLLPHCLLILGASISLVSFLGYYGVMNEKRWILWVHGMVLLIAIALQITVGAFAFAYRNQGNEVLDRSWERVFRSDPRVIQDLEHFFQCCGFEHVLDRPVPLTCAIDTRYMTGCRESIQTAFQDSLQAIGVIGAVLGAIELVSLLGAAILFHRFDQQRYQREQDEGEAALVRALLEAQHVDRQIEEARRQRQNQYESLAEQVRAQTLARAQEEGLLEGGAGRRVGGGGGSQDPPPYTGGYYGSTGQTQPSSSTGRAK
ncbi:Inositol-pentakisphosphate 2-kinase [Podila epigama]|nr:Inositol-pentakisphosphate 2-kinase [Podila epigama]